MLYLSTKAVVSGGLGLVSLTGALYYRRQNGRGRMGGAISRGKAIWLGFAIYVWFFLCPALALDAHVPAPVRVLLGTFGLSMWLRGAAELYLLFVGHAWRPPYGIGHDFFCLAVLLGQAFWLRQALVATGSEPFGWLLLAFLAMVAVSLVLEIGYAWGFYQLVRERTTGEEGVWFASKEDARFRTLVRVTALANVPLCAFLAYFLAVVLCG